jgi:hypothetical protein
MSENALEKLKREAKKKKYKKKVEAIKRKQVEREKVEQVCLTLAIYVEPLTLRKLIEKEFKIFEEKKKNKKLEEELKATLNFIMKTDFTTTT